MTNLFVEANGAVWVAGLLVGARGIIKETGVGRCKRDGALIDRDGVGELVGRTVPSSLAHPYNLTR